MRRGIVMTLGALTIAYAYCLALVFAIGFAAALPTPSWGPLMSARQSTLVWMHLIHAAAIALVSLPFAYVIGAAYRRFGVRLALATTIVICGAIEIPSLLEFAGKVGTRLLASWILDSLETVAMLPCLVWMVQRLLAKYRWSQPGPAVAGGQ